MRNEHELLKKLLEQILAMTDLPVEGEELLRDVTAALQGLLRKGNTLQEAARVLRLFLQQVANECDDALLDAGRDDAERGDGREHEDDTEPRKALMIDFELSMQIEGLKRRAITTFLHGSVVCQPIVPTNGKDRVQ